MNELFTKTILHWGQKNYRDFPWRKTKNPYHILVAEFLLQKTNSKMAEKSYNQFLKKYPTIHDLNNADVREIRVIFSEIGLFYRAERMKKIAHIIVNEYLKIPDNENNLHNLPGVGKYITNAILCFGFEKRVPIVDVNIARILIRYFNLHITGRPADNKIIWEKAKEILPRREFKKFNWLILDFGASICKTKPLCYECPLANSCKYDKKQIEIYLI